MDKLSDSQLYALVVNKNLGKDLKEQANLEFKKRNFSQEYIDQLAMGYENIVPRTSSGLPAGEKFRIIIFSVPGSGTSDYCKPLYIKRKSQKLERILEISGNWLVSLDNFDYFGN